MNTREIAAYIQGQRDMHVATLNRDGSAHMTTNWFGLDEAGRIVFNGYEASQKMVNLRRDPRITLLFASGDGRGCSIRGRVRFAEHRDENLRWLGLISERVRRMAGQTGPSAKSPEEMIAKRICVIVEAEEMTGLDG